MRPNDLLGRQRLRTGVMRFGALALLAGAAGAAGPQDTLQQVGPWRLYQGSGQEGTTGARWPALSADGDVTVFTTDGDPPFPLVTGNPDGNPEIFEWRGADLIQVTSTTRSGGAIPIQSRPSVSAAPFPERRFVALLSTADLDGRGWNRDETPQVWRWNSSGCPPVCDRRSFTAITGLGDGYAQAPSISATGKWIVFWYVGDLQGLNPEGGLELYVAGPGAVHRLTDLSGLPYHDLPAISADGSAITFIVQADLTGENSDGSWELFKWQGPPTFPGDASHFEQLTNWAPPMTGREIYHPTISGDGNRIAFAGRGHVDSRLTESHTEIEIYLWSAPDRVERLTRATTGNASSLLPQISGDGTHIAFVSLSDFAPGAPGNPDRDQQLFVWSECGPIAQVTAGTDRGGIVANVPEVAPPLDGDGRYSGFISETVVDPHPIALTSRLGILFRAVEDPVSPCTGEIATPTVTVAPSPSPTFPLTPSLPFPTVTPAGGPRVCPQVAARIPSIVQAQALVQPEAFYGWNVPLNPGLPPGPTNPLRRWLSIRDPGKPYGPANGAVWRAGCP